MDIYALYFYPENIIPSTDKIASCIIEDRNSSILINRVIEIYAEGRQTRHGFLCIISRAFIAVSTCAKDENYMSNLHLLAQREFRSDDSSLRESRIIFHESRSIRRIT